MKICNLRTCIVKKERFKKEELIRFVLNESNNVLLDVHKNLPGRGVYVHNDSSTIKKLIDKKLLNRAFKTNVDETFYQTLKEKFKI